MSDKFRMSVRSGFCDSADFPDPNGVVKQLGVVSVRDEVIFEEVKERSLVKRLNSKKAMEPRGMSWVTGRVSEPPLTSAPATQGSASRGGSSSNSAHATNFKGYGTSQSSTSADSNQSGSLFAGLTGLHQLGNGYGQFNGYNRHGNGYNHNGNGYNLHGNGYNQNGNGYNRHGNGYSQRSNGYNLHRGIQSGHIGHGFGSGLAGLGHFTRGHGVLGGFGSHGAFH